MLTKCINAVILIVLLGVTLFTLETESIESDRDVNRFSSGVKFTFLHEYQPTSKIWYHSYILTTPMQFGMGSHREWVMNANMTHPKSLWLDQCLSGHDADLNGRQPNEKLAARESDPRSYCVKYSAYIRQMITMIKQNHDLISEKLGSIKNLLPRDINNILRPNKRGLFDAGGFLLSKIFGLSTKADLDKISKQLKNIGTVVLHREDTFKQSLDSMSSFSKTLDKRIENLVKTVKQTALNTAEVFDSLATDLYAQLGFLVDMQRKIFNHESSVKLVLMHLDSFLDAVSQLTSGVLPSFLITPSMIQSSLDEISKSIEISHESLNLISVDPLHYYRKSFFTYSTLQSHLVITLAFPLTYFSPPFNVFQLTYYPLAVPAQPNSTMILKHQPSGVAFQKNFQHFFYLSSDDILEIKLTEKIDKIFRKVTLITNTVCIAALFQNKKPVVREVCEYIISVKDMQPSLLWMNKNNFLLTGIETYKLKCGLGLRQAEDGCNSQCILSPSSDCQLIANNEITIPVESNLTNLPVIHKYVLNYPYLNHFFKTEELQIFEGSEFLDAPPKLYLPPLKLFDNPVKALVKEDAKLELDMHTAISSIKRQDTLIHSIADGIVFTNQYDSGLFGDSVDYVVLGMIFAIAFMALQLTYCTVKLRALTLTLAVLQTHVVPRAEAQDEDGPVQLTFTIKPEATLLEVMVCLMVFH